MTALQGTLSDHVGEADLHLRRGVDHTRTIVWTQRSAQGGPFEPVHIDGDTGLFTLRSPHGDVWLSKQVVGTAGGYVQFTITAADLAGPQWAARSGGTWTLTLTHAGLVEPMGEGNFYLQP